MLGSILQDPAEAFEVLQREDVGRTHFYDLRNRELFVLMEKMHRQGEHIDIATVYHQAQKRGLAWAAEGAATIAKMPDEVPSVHSLPTFVTDLKDLLYRRTALDVSQRLVKVAADRSAPAYQLLEDSENAVHQLRRASAPAPLNIQSAAELIRTEVSEGDNILADRLLAKGQSLTLLGAGGLGKSRLLLQMAACCITGRPFVGLPTHAPGLKWIVFQAENSRRRLRHDLDRLRLWLGNDWDQVAERLLIHTVETSSDAFLQLDAPGVVQRLGDIVEQHDADVVCFDPLNCFGGGDLNRDGDMRASCQALTQVATRARADRALIVLHHALTGKVGAAKATGIERSSFGRNSKVLQAWTRGQINLAPANRDDNLRLVLSCGKCSNGEEFKPYAIKLNPETMIYEAEQNFNIRAWERELAGDQRPEEVDTLLEICEKPISRVEAAERMIDARYSRATAYRIIDKAIREKLVRLDKGQLSLNDEL